MPRRPCRASVEPTRRGHRGHAEVPVQRRPGRAVRAEVGGRAGNDAVEPVDAAVQVQHHELVCGPRRCLRHGGLEHARPVERAARRRPRRSRAHRSAGTGADFDPASGHAVGETGERVDGDRIRSTDARSGSALSARAQSVHRSASISAADSVGGVSSFMRFLAHHMTWVSGPAKAMASSWRCCRLDGCAVGATARGRSRAWRHVWPNSATDGGGRKCPSTPPAASPLQRPAG